MAEGSLGGLHLHNDCLPSFYSVRSLLNSVKDKSVSYQIPATYELFTAILSTPPLTVLMFQQQLNEVAL